MHAFHRRAATLIAAGGLVAAAVFAPGGSGVSGASTASVRESVGVVTTTPIKHLVVIFDENVSFDHYFATYPVAANPPGEPAFAARRDTPAVNGLANQLGVNGPTGPLLTSNPNLSNPIRLDRVDPMTCDQNHGYSAEQSAADHGAEDQYAQTTGRSTTLATCLAGLRYKNKPESVPAGAGSNYAVMDYYDGNTVTGLWNYAQHFAMSDNAFGTTYGPSTPGALNVTSAQTYGSICGPSFATINDAPCSSAPPGYNATDVVRSKLTTVMPTRSNPRGTTAGPSQPPAGPGTDYSDADPYYDICSYLPPAEGGDGATPASTIEMGGNNIGQELTTSGITWGWFQGGFEDGFVPGQGRHAPSTAKVCSAAHKNLGGQSVTDYISHHDPFQYYASTANPMHLPPTSIAMIGHSDQANHQYDLADFWAAADSGNLPAVSYLKAPAYQDGHAGYSDPLDEQTWLVDTINHLESLSSWSSTAIVVNWDDSDGWYDHVLGPLTTQSQTALDSLTGTGTCGSSSSQVPLTSAGQPEEGKCGVGPRIPLLVISSWSRPNYVDNTFIDQSSVVKFVEANWRLAALGNGAADAAAGSIESMFDFHARPLPRVILDPATGEVVSTIPIRGG